MTEVDTLVSQFIDDWNAGRRPAIDEWLLRVDESERDEFRRQLGGFLAVAPSPRFDESTIDALIDSPIVEAASAAFVSERSAWPMLLPRLRAQAGLSIRELAEHLLAAAGIEGRGVEKAADCLGEMERGELDAKGVSQRVVEHLGRLLGIRARDLLRAGMPVAAPAGGALYRRADTDDAAAADLEIFADALRTPTPRGDWDDVDELFFGEPRSRSG